jgi:soluble lytic murein transglycosylase-like protein
MRIGFSANNLLWIGIAVCLASPTFAEEQPKQKSADSEAVEIEAEDWIPLPVPRPEQMEIAEIEAGSGKLAYAPGAEQSGGHAVVTATTTATTTAIGPDDPDGLRQLVAQQAEINGIPAALANAVVTVESRYNPKARGSAGEIGLMQIKPDTARFLGFRGPDSALYHPATNVRWGMKYLAEAQRRGGGTVCGTILKYNAGQGAKTMNPISERYCEKVKALLQGKDA